MPAPDPVLDSEIKTNRTGSSLILNEINPEVFVSMEDVTLVNDDFIQILKEKARHTKNKRIRLCAHADAQDALHEMIIVLLQSSYVPPHAHSGKSESFHMIEGQADVILFDSAGTPMRAIHLAPKEHPGHFYYRLGSERFHTIIPCSETVVFHETTNGPFRREHTVNASWAPNQDAPSTVIEDYINQLRRFAVS